MAKEKGIEITISSLNVRGLVDSMKRKKTFGWIRRKKYSIYFLHETHSTTETEALWRNEWGYKGLFSNFSSVKRGVCILFNNNFSFQLLKQYCDPNGRYIIADVKINEKTLTLIKIYAPNKDELDFFQQVIDYAMTFECEDIVFVGDFNTVLNTKMDKKGGTNTTHSNSVKKLPSFRLI